MKKGFRYFLGCATIAVSSIFVAGCGDANIKNVTIDSDEIQFKMQLSDDSLTASLLTEQLKKQIFNELNASAVFSNGKTEAIEWGQDVNITIDQSEEKTWGKDTGLFKFKLQYGGQAVNFFVQVDAVTTGMDVSTRQNFSFEYFLSKGANLDALNNMVSVSLVQRSGFDVEGNATYSYLPLKTDAERENLSFEWVTEDKPGIDPLPQTGDIGVGTYQCVVTYTVPGTNITYTSEAVDVQISGSGFATVSSGETSGYAKLSNSQISSLEQNDVLDIVLSGNISFEKARDEWNGIEINKPAGNVAILKFSAPNGFKTELCKNPQLTVRTAYGTPGLESAAGENFSNFLNSSAMENAYFYYVLSFDDITKCYQFDIAWNENDVSHTYVVRLDQSNAVLENAEITELLAEWQTGADGVVDDTFVFEYGLLPSSVESFADIVNLTDVTENGNILHTEEILSKFDFTITSSVNIRIPGVYDNGLKITRKNAQGNLLTGTTNVAYLKIRVAEPSYGTAYVALSYSNNQTVTQQQDNANELCNVLIGGQFTYYNYPDASLGLSSAGYVLGAKIDAPTNLTVDVNAFSVAMFLSNDNGKTWHENQNADAVPELSIDGFDYYINAYALSQCKTDIAKFVIKWNADVAPQTYVLKYADDAVFELGEIALNTADENYANTVSSVTVGSEIILYGAIPFNQTTNQNTVPFIINAPFGTQFNPNATVGVYKLTSAGKNYVIEHFFDDEFELSKIGYNDRIDANDNTSAMFFELVGTKQGLAGCVEGQAFTNLNLDFSSEEFYRVVIDWVGDEQALYQFTISNMADIEIEDATDFSVSFSSDGQVLEFLVPFGTSIEDVNALIKQNLIATITTSNRNIVTDNYKIELSAETNYNPYLINNVYTFNITYLGGAVNDATLSKPVSIRIANPNTAAQLGVLDNTYQFEKTVENTASTTFDISGVVQKTNDGYVLNFQIFDPMSIGKTINYGTGLTLKTLKLSNTSDVLDSSTWQWVDDVVYSNNEAKSMILQQVYSGAGVEAIYGYAFTFNKVIAQNATDSLLPFAIQICWDGTLTQTFVINAKSATLQHSLTNSEIEAVSVGENGTTNVSLSKVDGTNYQVLGVVAMDEANIENPTYKLQFNFEAPAGFDENLSDSKCVAYFDGNIENAYSLPIVLNENKFSVSITLNDLNIDVITFEMMWGTQWFNVVYNFDITNLKYAHFATTEVLNASDFYPTQATVSDMSTNTNKVVELSGVLQKSTADINYLEYLINGSTTDILGISAGSHTAHLKLSSNEKHNENVKIGVIYSTNGESFDGVPDGEEYDNYRIWYNATPFLTSTLNKNAVLDIYLPYLLTNLNGVYNIKVLWDDSAMPVEINVNLAENTLAMSSFSTVMANVETSDTRATKNTYENVQNEYNTSFINAGTSKPFAKYFENYVISGISTFEMLSEYELNNCFAAGIKIAMPNDFINAENASVSVYAKREMFGFNGFANIEILEQSTLFSGTNLIVMLPIVGVNDEFIVEINWDTTKNYAPEYLHFSLSNELKYELGSTSTITAASLYPQQISYQQTGNDVVVSGNITYAVNDLQLGNGYFVSGKIEMPTIENSTYYQLDVRNAILNILKFNTETESFDKLSEQQFVLNYESNYLEFGVAVSSLTDLFKIEVIWDSTLPTVTETYNLSFDNEQTNFVLFGTEVSLYEDESQYGWTDGSYITTTTARVDGGTENKTVYQLNGAIGYTNANEDCGINSAGFVVAIKFNAPEGIDILKEQALISMAKGQYVESKFDDPVDYPAEELSIAKYTDTEAVLYLRVTDISDAFKVLIKWNNSHVQQTLYISISSDIQFVIEQDLTISANRTFSGNTIIKNANLTIAEGATLTINGILKISCDDSENVKCLENNGTISFGSAATNRIELGTNVNFVNNSIINNYSEERIVFVDGSQAEISGINVKNATQAFSSIKNAIINTQNNGTITLLNNIEQGFVIESTDIAAEKTINISGVNGDENYSIVPFELQTNNLKLNFKNIVFVTNEAQPNYCITISNLLDDNYNMMYGFENCTANGGMLIKSENLTEIDEMAIKEIMFGNYTGISFENGTVLSVYDSKNAVYTYDVILNLNALKQNYASNAVVVFSGTQLDVTGKQSLLSSGQTFICNEEELTITATQSSTLQIDCTLQISSTLYIDQNMVTITNLNNLFAAKLSAEKGQAYFATIEDTINFATENGITEIDILNTFNLDSTVNLQDNITYNAQNVVVSDRVILPQNAVLRVSNLLTLQEGAKLCLSLPTENLILLDGATKQGTGEIVVIIDDITQGLTADMLVEGYTYCIQNAIINSGQIDVLAGVKLEIAGNLTVQSGAVLSVDLQNLTVEADATISGAVNIVVPNNHTFTQQSEFVSNTNLSNANILYLISNATIGFNAQFDEGIVLNVTERLTVLEGFSATFKQSSGLVCDEAATISGSVVFDLNTVELTKFVKIDGATYNITNATVLQSAEEYFEIQDIAITGTLTLSKNVKIGGVVSVANIAFSPDGDESILIDVLQGGCLEITNEANLQNCIITVNGQFKAEAGLTVDASASLTISKTGTLFIDSSASLSGSAIFEVDATDNTQSATVSFASGETKTFTETTTADLSTLLP